MNLLDIHPQSIVFFGVVWILREVFGFLHKFKPGMGESKLIKTLLASKEQDALSSALEKNSEMLNKILQVLIRVETKLDAGRTHSVSNPPSRDDRI